MSTSTPHYLPITPRPRSGSAGARVNLKLGLNTSRGNSEMALTQIPASTVEIGSLQEPQIPTLENIHMNPLFPHDSKPNFFRHGKSMSFGGGGGSLNERVNLNQSMSSGLGSSGSAGSAFLTMRECDETMRDLRKENFNLKLRIYFLEERLGTARLVAAAGSKEELVQNNIELKVGQMLIDESNTDVERM